MKTICYTLLAAVSLAGCQEGFLDVKPSSGIVQPTTLDDFQQLLDNMSVMNRFSPILPQLSSDEYYYLSEDTWLAARTETERHAYIWNKDVFGGEVEVKAWNAPYEAIFYANSVLSGLSELEVSDENHTHYNEIAGAAYFFRANAFFELLKSFAPVYDAQTADTDLGIPLRLQPEIDEIVPRSSVRAGYNQVIADLGRAAQTLTGTTPPDSRNRPSKLAAYALFARLYTSMRQYDKAEKYADSVLALYNELIDYNTISQTSTSPFLRTNAETIVRFTTAIGFNAASYARNDNTFSVDSNLIASYDQNDLRLKIYFSPLNGGKGHYIKRGYNGTGVVPFTGLATDEIMLIKAECAARKGDTNIAMNLLNQLLETRFVTGTYIPLRGLGAQEALNTVLLERRKSLIWRSLRWDDLRRLNKEGANIVLTRVLGSNEYTLLPNSPRYVFNIPADEISMSHIQQNER
ncbi:RagB/SusD family nutrient uptake outer membrane protein [Parapedobacter sp. 2B3]|uniref:RagB/SusD family nutrient uptake outer membrane protein n=1 Tax=Parapedobacter sp. 2B3 TaxID=3342381 RepID=UPI0035B5CC6A